MNKLKKVYILYKYNNFKNDFEYIKEYYNTKTINNDFKLKNKKSIYNYIYTDIDKAFDINNKLFNKYIIIKEDI